MVKSTVSYLKKHWSLLICAAIAGVILSAARIQGGFFAFLGEFFNLDKPSFFEVYKVISPIIGSWWGTLLAIVAYSMYFAYIVGVVDRHMKIGEFRLGSPMRKINENFSFMFVVVVFFVIAEEIVNVLISLVASALLSLAAPVVAYVVTILAYILFQYVAIMFFVLISLWVPETVITGMSMKDSLSASLELGKDHFGKMLKAALACLAPVFLVGMIGAFLPPVLRVAVNTVAVTAIIAYIPVYVFTAYYEVSDLEREDLAPNKNFWKK